MIAHYCWGRRWCWGAAALSLASVGYFLTFEAMLSYLIVGILPGLILPECLQRLRDFPRAIAVTLAFPVMLAGWVASPWSGPRGVQIRQIYTTQMEIAIDQRHAAGWHAGDSEEAIWPKRRAHILELLPAQFGLVLLLIIVFNAIVLAHAVSHPFGLPLGDPPPGGDPRYFSNWRIPESWIWFPLASGAGLLAEDILSMPGNYPGVHLGLVGILEIFGAIYWLQGISILVAFMDAKRWRWGLRIPLVLIAPVGLIPLFLSVGFTDLWIDFRRRFRHL